MSVSVTAEQLNNAKGTQLTLHLKARARAPQPLPPVTRANLAARRRRESLLPDHRRRALPCRPRPPRPAAHDARRLAFGRSSQNLASEMEFLEQTEEQTFPERLSQALGNKRLLKHRDTGVK